jgi:hypothetical protein
VNRPPTPENETDPAPERVAAAEIKPDAESKKAPAEADAFPLIGTVRGNETDQ